MGEPSLGTPQSERPLEDRLDSWKEIAAYLKRDVTTVQRWEKREEMPVHRHLHDRMGSVYASRAELDAWMRSRNLRVAAGEWERRSVARPSRASADGTAMPLPRWKLFCRWQWRVRWRLARPLASAGRSTSGETLSRMHDFRRSRNSTDWSRPLRCHATAISWLFCRTGTDTRTSGSPRSDRVSSTI